MRLCWGRVLLEELTSLLWYVFFIDFSILCVKKKNRTHFETFLFSFQPYIKQADESIIVRGNGTIFLGGPPLVKAATGEDVTAEELGGAELHCTTSGVSDHLAENEQHAMALARQIISTLKSPINSNSSSSGRTATNHQEESKETWYDEPKYPSSELRGIIPADSRQPFDVRAVLARILDGSRYMKENTTIKFISIIPYAVCGLSKLYGAIEALLKY